MQLGQQKNKQKGRIDIYTAHGLNVVKNTYIYKLINFKKSYEGNFRILQNKILEKL